MSVVRLEEDDLDEEDLAILKEVAKKGYYHNRPKSEACAAPVQLEATPTRLGDSPQVKGRAAYDAFQAKWDRFDNDVYVEAVIAEGCTPSAGTKDSTPSTSLPAQPKRFAAEFNVLLLGDRGVGKTTFLLRHLTGEFKRSSAPHDMEVVSLRIATTCGELGFNIWELNHRAQDYLYCRGQAAIIMYDVGSRASWRGVPNFVRDVTKNCGTIPVVLVGNKTDLGRGEQTRSARLSTPQKRRLQHFEILGCNMLQLCRCLLRAAWRCTREGPQQLESRARDACFARVVTPDQDKSPLANVSEDKRAQLR